MALVTSQMTIPEANREGKLIKVPIKPGVFIKMYEGEARARGLLPPAEPKKREPVSNKKRTPEQSK
jgi:hypothetical protein